MKVNSRIIIVFLAYAFILSGCNTKQTKNNSHFHDPSVQEYAVKAVLWQQLSGEYRALTHQAFNLAKMQLDKVLEEKNSKSKPLAIITDIDETVLDNSPYSAKMIELNKNFSKKTWIKWGLSKKAKAIPGALEFFKYATSKNVEVFYISNRYDSQLMETLQNLKAIGFPYADKNHIFLKKEDSDKEVRRQKVLKNHTVVLLFGDNLLDFSSIFKGNSLKKTNAFVANMKSEFGKKFIVLPNPMYGAWEDHGIYGGRYNWTEKQKDSIRKSKLISW